MSDFSDTFPVSERLIIQYKLLEGVLLKMIRMVGDDGLIIPEVGSWSIRKYCLIEQYAHMFATSMKNKWHCRVLIDLFAGCGYSKIKGSNNIVKTSPLLTLDIPDPFDLYIFCDIDEEKINALEFRIKRDYPNENPKLIKGDVNNSASRIIENIPQPSKNFRVLSFCIVDPYNIGDLNFKTLEQLSNSLYIDFLVLIPSYMDANRNLKNYLKNNTIDKFLGKSNWRAEWDENSNRINFGCFIVQQFNKQMGNLDFIEVEDGEFIKISEPQKNCPLYHLAFYSKHKLAKKFWKEAIKGCSPQMNLFN